ncbi:MAG: hypothetical protein ACYC27_10230 [Armatimonadota bacterium]
MKSILRVCLAAWLLMTSAHHWFFCTEAFVFTWYIQIAGTAHPITLSVLACFWVIAHMQSMMKQYTGDRQRYAVITIFIELLSLSLPLTYLLMHLHTILLVLSLFLIASAGLIISRIQPLGDRKQVHYFMWEGLFVSCVMLTYLWNLSSAPFAGILIIHSGLLVLFTYRNMIKVNSESLDFLTKRIYSDPRLIEFKLKDERGWRQSLLTAIRCPCFYIGTIFILWDVLVIKYFL